MILSYKDLILYWKSKKIGFVPDIEESQIGESSIDLRMGTKSSRLVRNPGITIRPAISTPEGIFEEREITSSLIMQPKELILVLTMESVSLPRDLAADVQGRSSFARYGLAIHITSPHIQPAFTGPITLELYNHSENKLELVPGDRICQLIFSKVTSPLPKKVAEKSRYLGQKSPKPQPL